LVTNKWGQMNINLVNHNKWGQMNINLLDQ
jgi:hypothetical protein